MLVEKLQKSKAKICTHLMYLFFYQASETETYTASEFLGDIEDCRAKRIYVIADQSFSGLLAETIITSEKHNNVVVFASGGATEYSWNDELTWQWVEANARTHFSLTHTERRSKSQGVAATTTIMACAWPLDECDEFSDEMYGC